VQVTVIGASGFVGRHFVEALRARNDQVATASLRDPFAAAQACTGADAIVNLAGEPVAQRWSAQVKEKIRFSRVDSARALLAQIAALDAKPAVYVSASAIGIYGTSDSVTFTEASPPAHDFLGEVCSAWEAEADRAAELGMRVAKVRTGLVLGTDGGAMAKLLPVFRIGAGGVIGSGQQWYSWIHIDDLVGIYLHALDGASGALNGTAPNPVRNAEFTRALGKALHRPTLVPVPKPALELMLGEGASVVLEGQRVLPERTLESGYRFRYEMLDAALAQLLGG
jgi:uncharacterized protein (TIGR01777 family)